MALVPLEMNVSPLRWAAITRVCPGQLPPLFVMTTLNVLHSLPASPVEEGAHLPAKTHLPIFALHATPLPLLGVTIHHPKEGELYLMSHLSLSVGVYNFTHVSQGAKSFLQNLLHHFCTSFPPIFLKASFILSIHLTPCSPPDPQISSLQRLGFLEGCQ